MPQSRWRQPLLIVGGVLVGVLGLAVVLPKDPAPTPKLLTPPTHTARVVDSATTFAATPTPLQWKAVIEQLDRRRGLAFIHAQFREFYNIDADGSAALNTDQAMTMALRDVHAHAETFPLRVKSVTEQYVTVGERVPRAMLTVVDAMGAYNLVDAQGKVVRHIPARGERSWNVELERSPLWGWVYVSAVSAALP